MGLTSDMHPGDQDPRLPSGWTTWRCSFMVNFMNFSMDLRTIFGQEFSGESNRIDLAGSDIES